jgi:hypothetical protein
MSDLVVIPIRAEAFHFTTIRNDKRPSDLPSAAEWDHLTEADISGLIRGQSLSEMTSRQLGLSLAKGWPQSAEEERYCGFILQQIFATEGPVLGRPMREARKRCLDDREPNFAINLHQTFKTTRLPNSIGFRARRKTYPL